MPSDEEISAAEVLLGTLIMFHSATEIVSGEKYSTLGIVKPLLQELLYHTLAITPSDKGLAKQIKKEDLQVE